MGAFKYLLDLIYPPRCQMCGEIMPPSKEYVCFCPHCSAKWEQEKTQICPSCRREVRVCRCRPVFDKNSLSDAYRALVLYYSQNVKNVIFKLKRDESKALTDFLSKELCFLIFRNYDISSDNVVIAYPQRSRKSVKKHGYDHAASLCKYISKQLGLPLFDGIRHRSGAEQKTLNAEQRGVNAAKSYYIPEKYSGTLKNKKVILIDDVVTTGATATVCAALCKANGALSVSVFSIAKTP